MTNNPPQSKTGTPVVVIEHDGSDQETVEYNPMRPESYWRNKVQKIAAERGVPESEISIRFSTLGTNYNSGPQR